MRLKQEAQLVLLPEELQFSLLFMLTCFTVSLLIPRVIHFNAFSLSFQMLFLKIVIFLLFVSYLHVVSNQNLCFGVLFPDGIVPPCRANSICLNRTNVLEVFVTCASCRNEVQLLIAWTLKTFQYWGFKFQEIHRMLRVFKLVSCIKTSFQLLAACFGRERREKECEVFWTWITFLSLNHC